MLLIANAALLTAEARQPSGPVNVLLDGEHITRVEPAGANSQPAGVEIFDAAGLYLAPGFIDLQINGGFGHDFTLDPESIWAVAAGLPRFGVTSFLPTIISSPAETVRAAQAAWRRGPPAEQPGAQALGLHLEGPFLNRLKRGAHNPEHLRAPDLDLARGWSLAAGVCLVTLAPELPGALEVARQLAAQGVLVSAGHSMATVEQAQAGFAAGIRYGTHLFNAMPPLEHRAPGLAGALLAEPEVTIGVIADGVHLHPAALALAWQAKKPLGLTLVSDAMAAMGMPPGRYQLGDYEVIVDASAARLPDGRLAGSRLSLDEALRHFIFATGCTPAEAVATVTTAPARLLGLHDRGRVAQGCRADLVLLTQEMHVAATWVAGRKLFEAERK